MRLRSPSLFWRTFLLIVALLATALLTWVQSFRVFEREPRARQIAQQVVSVVNITRSALLFSDSARRRELLADLTDNEGIRIVPVEAADDVQPLPDVPLVQLATAQIKRQLGEHTRLAAQVNGVAGIWVSFNIDDDAYWVFIERDPLARELGRTWLGWATAALLLSVLVALAITRVVNLPLARLTRAAVDLGAGRAPAPLPDEGPAEIRAVNQSFNRMVADLAQMEQDRVVLLAGISHDLRTPLTRLRLELDMNALPDAARAAMIDDIEQLDAIVGQFLDYARPLRPQSLQDVDLAALASEVCEHSRLANTADAADVRLETQIDNGVRVRGVATELRRALDNLLTNAARYGRDRDGLLVVRVVVQRDADAALIRVCDRGLGIAADQIDRLMRPFERGDPARGGSTGAGLGLAIVERIARLHGGSFTLLANQPGGLCAQMRLPLLP